jgi:hypothetical protein
MIAVTLISQDISEVVLCGIRGRDVWDIQNRVHLLVEEHNLIILGDDDAIMIDFNQVLKHLKQLSLLPAIDEVLPITLVESAGEKIDEHQGHGPVAKHSHVLHLDSS